MHPTYNAERSSKVRLNLFHFLEYFTSLEMDTADWPWQTAFLKMIDFLCDVDSVSIFINTKQRFKLDFSPDISLIVLKTRLLSRNLLNIVDFYYVESVFLNIDNHALSRALLSSWVRTQGSKQK